jgi:hypothetical protein
MVDLGIDPHRAVHDYEWQTARRMQSRAFKAMAADLKKALGRGYKVRVVKEGDLSSRHGWNWKMFVVLLVTAPQNAWEQEVSVVLNIADTESSGNVSTKDSGVLPAGRSDKPEVVWGRLRETAVGVLAPERTHRRNNAGTMSSKQHCANAGGVTMDDLTSRDGLQLSDEDARELMAAINDTTNDREARDVIQLADRMINAQGEFASFGVESLEAQGERYAQYLNTGDTYSVTLLYDEGEWYVTTWGDWMEQAEQKYAEDWGLFWLIPYTVEVEGSMPSKLFAIVQAPKKEDAIEHFTEAAVAMGDDDVWDGQIQELGGVSPEQTDGAWYAVGTDPDAEDESLVAYLTIGEPDQPWRTMDEARYEARGGAVRYEHTED